MLQVLAHLKQNQLNRTIWQKLVLAHWFFAF
jgi:hypothetical protein